MSKSNLTPKKGYSHTERFKIAGVTFNNRQSNLKKIQEQIQKEKPVNINIEQYDYKGEPAISVMVNGLDIGNLHKKDVEYVLANQERIIGFTDLYIDTFTNEEGKVVFYANVELLVRNKTADTSAVAEPQQQDSPVQAQALQTNDKEPTSSGKKPFYKNWIFWVAIGAGLTIIYIIATIAGFTK